MASMGRRIAQARHEAGFDSAEALARELGVSGSAVRKWEADEHTPRRKHIEKIAELTDRTVGFFFGDETADMHAALEEVRTLLAGNGIPRLTPDGRSLPEPLISVPVLTAGESDRGGDVTMLKAMLPQDVPPDRLAVAYADADAPDAHEGDMLLVDTGGGVRDGDLVAAALDGEVVVRQVYGVGDQWLLRGSGDATLVEESALLGRVVTIIGVRHLERSG